MNNDELLKECRSKAFNTSQLSIINEAVEYGIEPMKIRILAKTQYNELQMEQLLRALKENLSPEIIAILANEKLNHLAMAEIINSAVEGLTIEDIMTYVIPSTSPQEMGKNKQKLIKQKKDGESGALSTLMEGLKMEMEALSNSFKILEKQSTKFQDMLFSQNEEELNKTKQLLEAKELVIKNLQASNREKLNNIAQLTRNIEEKEQALQNHLIENNILDNVISSARDIDIEESASDKAVKCSEASSNEAKLNKYTLYQPTEKAVVTIQTATTKKDKSPLNKSSMKKKMNLIFAKKEPNLMHIILEKKLTAEQTKEIRLGISAGLSEEQLILMADAELSTELLAEIRNTMMQLNERRKECEDNV